MFENSGGKIKIVAYIAFVLGLIASLIGAIAYGVLAINIAKISKQLQNLPEGTITLTEIKIFIYAILILAAGVALSYVVALIIHGFADIIDNTAETADRVHELELNINKSGNSINKKAAQKIEEDNSFYRKASKNENEYSSTSEMVSEELNEAQLTFTKIPDSSECGVFLKNFTSKNVIIPAEHNGLLVTKIERGAFFCHRKLQSVAIPETIIEIGAEAFMGCTLLDTIQYNGTKEQWFEIKKGTDWDNKTGNYKIEFLWEEL